MSDELKLRLPSDIKLEQIRGVLQDDEDWRFGRIKMDGKKPRFELPAPTKDEPDNVEIEKTFYGVVLVAKKNYYQSDEDKEKGNDPREKRALYILRVGKYMPELMYVSPTAIRNWKYFARDVVQNDKTYYEVLCEFSAEQIRGKQYTWSKPTFKIARTLTETEATYVKVIRELVEGRVKEYENNAELDRYEDTALGVDKSREDTEETLPKRRNAEVEVDDEDTPAAPAKKEEKPKKSPKDDGEEEKPKSTKKSRKDDEEEEEEDKPKSKGRAGYPDLDEDEDEDLSGTTKDKSEDAD